MDFVRFTGELFIYYVLIALGGVVLIGFTVPCSEAIGIDWSTFVQSGSALRRRGRGRGRHLARGGEAERHREHGARPDARLHAALRRSCCSPSSGDGSGRDGGIDVEREILIAFDLLLVVVFGLLLYSLSARDPRAPPGAFDWIQVTLVVTALVVDVLALWAIAAGSRIRLHAQPRRRRWGRTSILLVNLAWSALLYVRFLSGRGRVREPRAVADHLPARLCRVGGDRRDCLSAGVRLQLAPIRRFCRGSFLQGVISTVRAASGQRGGSILL